MKALLPKSLLASAVAGGVLAGKAGVSQAVLFVPETSSQLARRQPAISLQIIQPDSNSRMMVGQPTAIRVTAYSPKPRAEVRAHMGARS